MRSHPTLCARPSPGYRGWSMNKFQISIILLGFTAIAAQLDLGLDSLLSDEAASPCELNPCIPLCKTVVKNAVGKVALPMSSTECSPDRACLEAKAKCLGSIRSQEKQANSDLTAALKRYSDTGPSSTSVSPSSDSRVKISQKQWGLRRPAVVKELGRVGKKATKKPAKQAAEVAGVPSQRAAQKPEKVSKATQQNFSWGRTRRRRRTRGPCCCSCIKCCKGLVSFWNVVRCCGYGTVVNGWGSSKRTKGTKRNMNAPKSDLVEMAQLSGPFNTAASWDCG